MPETDIDPALLKPALADYILAYARSCPERIAEAFTADGWLKTGDLVEVLPDGNVRFSARVSDMFKSGGYNVYPREVEIALEEHAAITTAAVVGVADSLYGEVVWQRKW